MRGESCRASGVGAKNRRVVKAQLCRRGQHFAVADEKEDCDREITMRMGKQIN